MGPGGSQGASPPGRREVIERSLNIQSPDSQREMKSPIDEQVEAAAAFPNRSVQTNIPTQMDATAARMFVQPRAGMSQTWQPNSQGMPISSPGGPNFNHGPAITTQGARHNNNNSYGGSQPQVSP